VDDHVHVTTEMPGGATARIDVTGQHLVVLAKGKICVVGKALRRDPWMTPAEARELAASLLRVAS